MQPLVRLTKCISAKVLLYRIRHKPQRIHNHITTCYSQCFATKYPNRVHSQLIKRYISLPAFRHVYLANTQTNYIM